LYVRLENRGDRCVDAFRLCQIAVDQSLMGVDDSELPFRQAAEEIRRTGRLLEEERTEEHVPRLGAQLESR
jgi:hypothetical protein